MSYPSIKRGPATKTFPCSDNLNTRKPILSPGQMAQSKTASTTSQRPEAPPVAAHRPSVSATSQLRHVLKVGYLARAAQEISGAEVEEERKRASRNMKRKAEVTKQRGDIELWTYCLCYLFLHWEGVIWCLYYSLSWMVNKRFFYFYFMHIHNWIDTEKNGWWRRRVI